MNIVVLGLAFLAIVIHLARLKERPAVEVVEVVLLYLLVFPIGVGSTLAGLFHVFNGPATAAMIGWPAGSPFQYEVGVADLAFGLLGFLCLFFRGNFWLATILANGVFLLGAMIGHAHDLLTSGNQAAYNIGPNIIFADLLMPLFLFALYIWLQKLLKD